MSDYTDAKRVSVTIKGDDGKAAPWAVFHGGVREVVEQMGEFFGFDTEGLTAHEAMIRADQAVKGVQAFRNIGAKVAPVEEEGKPEEATPEPEATAQDFTWLQERVDAEDTSSGLKRLWMANRSAFDQAPEVFASLQAKGKRLAAEGK